MASNDTRSLRAWLKSATRERHDALDRAMGMDAPAEDRAYARFLSVQYAAHSTLERWAEEICPPGWRHPAQSVLVARDLASLEIPLPAPLPLDGAEAPDWRGLAWALGGSSLGNRTMLVRRRKAGSDCASAFLSDPALPAYFARILPLLAERMHEPSAAGAIRAANAAFACFEAAHARGSERLAA